MSASINYRLGQLAESYYIKYGSYEQLKIDNSVQTLQNRLKYHFGADIKSIVEFGSYKRDTILPRQIDEHSDVDLLIVFDHDKFKVTPGTYRNKLLKFAAERYASSDVKKSLPTVVLELDHIKYDLVPAKEEINAWTRAKTFFIPSSDYNWKITDPNGFSTELTQKNGANYYNIKKVIRLLKAWNAKVGYPIESFTLEQEITRMHFWNCITLEDYFFAAITNLSAYRGLTYLPHPKIISLKENAMKVKNYLTNNNLAGAATWLAHILP